MRPQPSAISKAPEPSGVVCRREGALIVVDEEEKARELQWIEAKRKRQEEREARQRAREQREAQPRAGLGEQWGVAHALPPTWWYVWNGMRRMARH